jgi:hypothetical protein
MAIRPWSLFRPFARRGEIAGRGAIAIAPYDLLYEYMNVGPLYFA